MPGAAWAASPAAAIPFTLVVLLGGAWMTVGPQLPGLRGRGPLLAVMTWLATRPVAALLAWGRLAGAGGAGHPGVHVAVVLVADLVAWRALAAAGEDGEAAAWNYVASPAVWALVVPFAAVEPVGGACVALAWALARRDRAGLASLALAVGALVGGAPAALAATAPALASRRRALPLAAIAGALALRALLPGTLANSLAARGWAAGAGPTLWRLPLQVFARDPGPAAWAPLAAVLALGAWRLARRGAGAGAHAAWAWGACAALAPGIAPAAVVVWAPLLAVWAAPDPDRRGWWLLYGTLLPLAVALEAGPLEGAAGPAWHPIAIAGVLAAGGLALWPMRQAWREGAPARD